MRKILLLTSLFALTQMLSGCLSVAVGTAKVTSSVISAPVDFLLGSDDDDEKAKEKKAKEEKAKEEEKAKAAKETEKVQQPQPAAEAPKQ